MKKEKKPRIKKPKKARKAATRKPKTIGKGGFSYPIKGGNMGRGGPYFLHQDRPVEVQIPAKFLDQMSEFAKASSDNAKAVGEWAKAAQQGGSALRTWGPTLATTALAVAPQFVTNKVADAATATVKATGTVISEVAQSAAQNAPEFLYNVTGNVLSATGAVVKKGMKAGLVGAGVLSGGNGADQLPLENQMMLRGNDSLPDPVLPANQPKYQLPPTPNNGGAASWSDTLVGVAAFGTLAYGSQKAKFR